MDLKKRTLSELDRERALLAKWLSEWELDHSLSDPEAPNPQPSLARSIDFGEPGAKVEVSNLRAGTILLLKPPPAGSIDPESPLYVLVVEKAESSVLIVPFSRFQTPAIPEEWLTRFAYTPLQVLCYWNERSLAVDYFPGCWHAQTLTTKQLQSCLQARMHILIGRISGTGGAGRLGPRLIHPGDPRHEYLAEERVRLDQHLVRAQSGSHIVEEEAAPYLADDAKQRDAFLLAAETITGYGVRGGTYMTEDHEVVVATYVEDPSRIRIRVVDREGRMAKQYEGGYLEGITGVRSDRIRQGIALAHPDLAANLAVIVAPGHDPIRLITTFS